MPYLGAYSVVATNFGVSGAGRPDNFDFRNHALNITLSAQAAASVSDNVSGAVSADMYKACVYSGDTPVLGTGAPMIVNLEVLNTSSMSAEYFPRQTCGSTPLATPLSGRYAVLNAGGFAASGSQTQYYVVSSGILCEDAMPFQNIALSRTARTAAPQEPRILFAQGKLDDEPNNPLEILPTKARFTYPYPTGNIPLVSFKVTGDQNKFAVIDEVTEAYASCTFTDDNGDPAELGTATLEVHGILPI